MVYWRRLPHFRAAGAIYHVRFSVHPAFRRLNRALEFQIVQDAIIFGHKRTYILFAYVVMPNHVHLVRQPLPKESGWAAWCNYRRYSKLESIIGCMKKFSARKINRAAGRRGSVWQDESYDRIIRGGKDLNEVVDYVHHNPVTWGLVQKPELYPWSSASTIYSGRDDYRDWFAFNAD